jgi:hypothetical protein
MKSLRFVSAPHNFFSSRLLFLDISRDERRRQKELIYDGKKFAFSQTIDDLHEINSW